MSRTILLIEDDPVLGEALLQRLRLEGFVPHWARSLAEGEGALRKAPPPDVVLCDMRLPDGSGEALLLRLLPELGATPVIAMTAYGGVEQAVRLIRAGADDYLLKPFDMERLLEKLRALPPRARQVGLAAAEVPGGWQSPAMRALDRALHRLAPTSTPVLLLGESGSGKEVTARRLHALGPRVAAPFVAINCAAIPRDLLESEVFGHERGAFTGATERRPGAAEQAGTGTLMLDEVAELDLQLQAKLLRLLDQRRFQRVGGSRELRLEARVIAATNADLVARVRQGLFREDLYFRLAVVELRVPPLRERIEDLDALSEGLLASAAEEAGRAGLTLSPAAQHALRCHAWPGNVRELRNRLARAAVLTDGPNIGPEDLFPDHVRSSADPETLVAARDAAEREHIRRVLLRCGGRIGEAARILGIGRTTLWERLRRLGLSGVDEQ